MLEFLFSSNKRKWLIHYSKNKTPFDDYLDTKLGLIVKNFFVKDNIDFKKYQGNETWHNKRFALHDMNEKI